MRLRIAIRGVHDNRTHPFLNPSTPTVMMSTGAAIADVLPMNSGM
jgi:hypothetical protein